MQKQLESSQVDLGGSHDHSSSVFWGTFYGGVSAVAYTAANIGLRTVTDCDPVWVSCVKAVPTVIGVLPWLVLQVWHRQQPFPPWRVLLVLVVAGIFGNFAGNVTLQWAFGVIGIAVSVPLCMGAMIVASAVLGRVHLNESITAKTIAALAVLIAAISVLSSSAPSANEVIAGGPAWIVIAGVIGACVSGFAYAVLGLVIRVALLQKSTVAATTFSVAFVGCLALGVTSLVRLGAAELLATTPSNFGTMMLAGVFNLIAFVSLTRALQITTLVYVNALNASQVAMASLAGVVLFQEAASSALGLGVAMTVVGLLLMPRGGRRP